MPLSAGTRLGPYEVLAPIGAGGMGEVYRACDTRLGREVGVKVSARQFTERFEREQRAWRGLLASELWTRSPYNGAGVPWPARPHVS